MATTTSGPWSDASASPRRSGALPLEGVRVADFSWYAAGPFCTLMLGMLGAEVIRLESRTRPDSHRKVHPAYGRNYVAPYDQLLSNRLSAAMNLKEPRAREIAKQLVAKSDVVVENFRPGVMTKMGLGYADLAAIRPDLVMLSLSASGQAGPQASIAGYAPVFSALAGLGELSGYEDGPPLEMRNAMDHVCGLVGSLAVVTALWERRWTGAGRYIDLSNREVGASLIGHALVDFSVHGRVARREGNRSESAAPHNAYPCAGHDRWVSIAARTEAEWHALVLAMGRPSWADDVRFADLRARKANEAELDRLISSWTHELDPYEVMIRCQRHGAPAFPVITGEDMVKDPHLRARGTVTTLEHPAHGSRVVLGPPWRFSGSPVANRRWSPAVGEHNSYVYGSLLGLSAVEIAALEEAKILY